MKLGGIRKALLAASPLAVTVAGYLGFDVTVEWWQALIEALAPFVVYYFANNEDKPL